MTKYKKFKREIKRLLKKAQFAGGWEVTFTNEADIGENLARCTYNVAKRWVRFSFNSKKIKKTKGAILAAKHEVGHLLIARMEWLGGCRYLTDSEMDEESENFARIMEKLL